MASLAVFFPGTDAGAAGHTDASQVAVNPSQVTTRACGTVNVKGVTDAVHNAGNPFKSDNRNCLNGHLISYGNTAITYANPPQSFIDAGRLLFAQTCSSCHGNEANGVGPEGQAHDRPEPPGRRRRHRRLLGEHGPYAGRRRQGGRGRATADPPHAAPGPGAGGVGELARPVGARPCPTRTCRAPTSRSAQDLFSLNCAACHTITGRR